MANTNSGKNVCPLKPSTIPWLIKAEIIVIPKPAYAHSLYRPFTKGKIKAKAPTTLKTVSITRK